MYSELQRVHGAVIGEKDITKRVTVFDKPVLQISPEELGEKVTSIMERVNRALECFSVGKRSIGNVPVGSSILRRTVLLLVQHRGHLLLDVRPRELYFLGEVAQDMESYLEEQPLYAPRRKGEVGDFVESLWRSITGQRSRACAAWRQKRTKASTSLEASAASSQVESDQVESPAKGLSGRVIQFPELE